MFLAPKWAKKDPHTQNIDILGIFLTVTHVDFRGGFFFTESQKINSFSDIGHFWVQAGCCNARAKQEPQKVQITCKEYILEQKCQWQSLSVHEIEQIFWC